MYTLQSFVEAQREGAEGQVNHTVFPLCEAVRLVNRVSVLDLSPEAVGRILQQ